MQRQTIQKRLVLEAVNSMNTHPTAEEIYEKVKDLCPGISRATVYRILGTLSEEGQVNRVAVANAPDRFDFTLEKHAHLLCSACGRVFDLELDSFPSVSASASGSFIIKKLNVTAEGLCTGCALKSSD